MGFLNKFFGSNEREIRKLQPIVEKINSFESAIGRLGDEELKAKTQEFKKRISAGETLDEIMPEAFAVVREAAGRVIGEKHYNVQLLGGIVLHSGKIAEIGPVETGKTYKAPQNEKVTITFSKLPEKSGKLKIEEITLTDDQMSSLGALSDKAYDITSDMDNGTFKYDLTLPKANIKDAGISYVEKSSGELNGF
jgi:hypothetical protein